MKIITLYFCAILANLSLVAQQQNAAFTVMPNVFNENDEITITVNGINPATWGVTDLYLWTWSFDSNDTNIMDSPTNGTWTNSDDAQKLIPNGNGTYSFTFTPTVLYNRTNIGRIGMLVKAKDGTGDKKTQDQLYDVGIFQLNRIEPNDVVTLINVGESVTIRANTSLDADFTLFANETLIHTAQSTSAYTFSVNPIETTTYILESQAGSITLTEKFQVVVRPSVTEAPVPEGMQDGLNLDTSDNKEFIHVIGNFNNWSIDNVYLMKKDPSSHRFWIELTNLLPQTNYLYQYVVNGEQRVADPYSTLILDQNNDQFINHATYPNLPEYPTAHTEHAVTVLRTGDSEYNWQITNFQKPEKTDLVIYELLIRDFDQLHSFNAVKERLDYLQGLGINAIEFMPISEFDGNESWGYNPSFHMALDKYYGTKASLKKFIDACHQRGIAVILDIVYNHASGQHPYYRMWNTDNGNYGGQAASDSPFFNQTATHSYNVFNDFNHSLQTTKNYVKRTTQYWINEYHIDGFRWDLTKGFTQNCSESDEACTNAYQADRVAILKEYADYQWEIDPDFYVIFEHLGTHSEETEWVNYRISEGKGIMLWSNLNSSYNETTMGFHDAGKSDFSWISYQKRNWTVPANISYMESHDEERLMYKNIEFGNSNTTYNASTLNTALDRLQSAGAFYFTIPGPKMIWQFGELGYDVSINFNGRVGKKPIRWEYYDDPNRKAVYNTWSQLITLKHQESIFRTTNFKLDVDRNNGLKTIHLTNDDNSDDLKHVVVLGNFGITTQTIAPEFQIVGTWYNLLDNNRSINVTNTSDVISLLPGEFRIYGSSEVSLSNPEFTKDHKALSLYPNPATTHIRFNEDITNLKIYTLLGEEVFTQKVRLNKLDPLNIEHLSPGVYIIKIVMNNRNTTKKLIIK